MFLLVVAAVVAFLSTLLLKDGARSPSSASSEMIEVHVAGAVQVPGTVVIPRLSTLSDLLQELTLLPDADSKSLDLHRKLRRGVSIEIPFKKLVTVYLQGDPATAGAVVLPDGATYRDLTEQLSLRFALEYQRFPYPDRCLEDQQIVWVGKSRGSLVDKTMNPQENQLPVDWI